MKNKQKYSIINGKIIRNEDGICVGYYPIWLGYDDELSEAICYASNDNDVKNLIAINDTKRNLSYYSKDEEE